MTNNIKKTLAVMKGAVLYGFALVAVLFLALVLSLAILFVSTSVAIATYTGTQCAYAMFSGGHCELVFDDVQHDQRYEY